MATYTKRKPTRKVVAAPKENPRTKEFSKWLLYQETILIWLVTITFLILAFVCVSMGYGGELPWLTAMSAFPWTAYGVSQAFYYRKSLAENTCGGIKYESIMAELKEHEDPDVMG
jgi:hypothetical protein